MKYEIPLRFFLLPSSYFLSFEFWLRVFFSKDPDVPSFSPFRSWLPFYHDMGLIGHVLVPMYSCGSNYFLSPLSFLRDPLLWPRCLSKYNVGITGGPNFAFALLTSSANALSSTHPLKGVDLSNLRIMFCGAEPISTSVISKFFSLYSRWGLKETCFLPCYGLAEGTLCVTVHKTSQLTTRIVVDRVSLEVENKVKLLKNLLGVGGMFS
jgi:acyl-CoA synthetase (AMP-forming)/AMP-acid ligase II